MISKKLPDFRPTEPYCDPEYERMQGPDWRNHRLPAWGERAEWLRKRGKLLLVLDKGPQ